MANKTKYEMVYAPDAPGAYESGLIPKSRLCAQQMINRELRPGEVVTFLDGDRTNFSHSNLIVMKSRSDARRFASNNRNVGLIKLADGTYTYSDSVWAERGEVKTKHVKSPSMTKVVEYLKTQPSPSLNGMAAFFNIPATRVRKLLFKYNLSIMSYASSDDVRLRIIKMINSGQSLAKVAAELKLTYAVLTSRMHWLGLKLVNQKLVITPAVRIPAELFERAARSLTVSEIAAELGTYPAAVDELARLYEINVNYRHPAKFMTGFTREEILTVAEYAKLYGLSLAIKNFKRSNTKFTQQAVTRCVNDTENFIIQNERHLVDVDQLVGELNAYRDGVHVEQPNVDNELSDVDQLGDVVIDELHGTIEPEVSEPEVSEPEVSEPEVSEPEVSEPEVSKPEVSKPEVSEQPQEKISEPSAPTKRTVAKRDLVVLVNAGLENKRIARLLEINEERVDELLNRYHLTPAYGHAVALLDRMLPHDTIAWFNEKGLKPREVAEFLKINHVSLVRLHMYKFRNAVI